jgi:hypothetical protein
MTGFSRNALYWTPRVLCIAFGLFMSLFALDVFGEGLGFWRTLIALLIHLVPIFGLFAILAVAWRWEWVGAVLFAALAVLYDVWAGGRHFHWPVLALVSGPLYVIAALFLVNWLKHAELHARP